jgi:26S proteasome regulatory subunit N1
LLTFGIGTQDASDATVETLKAIDHPISKTAQILVEACSFAGTGNVLKIQSMLHHCDEHVNLPKKDEEKKDSKDELKRDDSFQAFAVIAIALIAMGEDIGAEMSLRQFNHLVSWDDHYSQTVC